jgi:hypothetical protein
MMTWVSQRQPSANSGRIGRSIRREVSVSFSVGARRVVFLGIVDRQRQEVDAGLWLLGRDHGRDHGGFAVGGDDGAVGLARYFSGFQG